MTLLASGVPVDFQTMKTELGLTDGNLGAHLRVLEESGFVRPRKAFVDRRPRTTYTITEAGRLGFSKYLDRMEEVIRQARDAEGRGMPDG